MANPELPGPELGKALADERVESLFSEVIALANQLRKGAGNSPLPRSGDRSVLAVLGDDGALTVPEIARVRETSRQNIQLLVNRLQGEGLVEFADNPGHRNSALVRMTEQGRAALGRIKEQEQKSLAHLLAQIPDGDLAATLTILRRVRALLARTSLHAPGSRNTGPAPAKEPSRLARQEPPQPALPRSFEARDLASQSAAAPEVAEEEAFPVSLL